MLCESESSLAAGQETRRPKAVPVEPWLRSRDLLVVVLLLALWTIGHVLPESRWHRWARKLADRRLRRSARLNANELATVGVVVGQGKKAWIENSFRRDWLAHKYLSWIQHLACCGPSTWRPRPRLVGSRHLDEALAEGRGVILFTANFVYKDLMSKAALFEAGFEACHLVRDSHGFSESRLGKRLLNPIHAAIERRYLKERLVFSGADTASVNMSIKECLRRNEIVLVTVTPLGRRVSVLPFLHGRIRIATGALNFACETGALVLPLFTIRKPDGSIDAIVEHPLAAPENASREGRIEAMLEDYVPRLETYVAQDADQFAFPTSAEHGEALIEPWAGRPQAKEKGSRPVRRGEAVPEFG